MAMDAKKKAESIARGAALLLQFGMSPTQVRRLKLSRDVFKTAAAAKAWARNHGFDLSVEPVSLRDHFTLQVRRAREFASGSLHEVELTGAITAEVGDLIAKVQREDAAPPAPPAQPEETALHWSGEIFISKAAEGDTSDPEKEVRVYGIVSKPEVPDAEGTVISAEEIEQANDLFMREFQTIGLMHAQAITEKVKILQNVIAPVDIEFPLPDGATKLITKGTWYQQLFTDDEELVGKIRRGEITGLSIGGYAKKVPLTEMRGGRRVLVTDRGWTQAQKRALDEYIAKAEGDEAKERFVQLRVEEVSLVDAAANEEVWFITKRKPVPEGTSQQGDERMSTKKEGTTQNPEPGAAPPQPAQTTASVPPAPAPAPTPAATPPITTEDRLTNLEGKVERILVAVERGAAQPPQPQPAPEPVKPGDEVSKRLATLEETTKSQGDELVKTREELEKANKALEQAAVTRAAAQGQSVPPETASATTPPAPVSKWAGTAVGLRYGKDKGKTS